MWAARITGLIIASAGGSLAGLLWLELMDRGGRDLFVHRLGLPGALLLAALGVVAVVFGLYLLLDPQSALRRRPVRRRRSAQAPADGGARG